MAAIPSPVPRNSAVFRAQGLTPNPSGREFDGKPISTCGDPAAFDQGPHQGEQFLVLALRVHGKWLEQRQLSFVPTEIFQKGHPRSKLRFKPYLLTKYKGLGVKLTKLPIWRQNRFGFGGSSCSLGGHVFAICTSPRAWGWCLWPRWRLSRPKPRLPIKGPRGPKLRPPPMTRSARCSHNRLVSDHSLQIPSSSV